MAKRKKRLIKQEKGLLEQTEKHRKKIEEEIGKKDTTHEYWEKEIRGFEKRARERAEILKKLTKSKNKEIPE